MSADCLCLHIHLRITGGPLKHFANTFPSQDRAKGCTYFELIVNSRLIHPRAVRLQLYFPIKPRQETLRVCYDICNAYCIPYLSSRNMTSRSKFFTKSRRPPGVYSQVCSAVQIFNIFCDERTPYHALDLNRAFAPQPTLCQRYVFCTSNQIMNLIFYQSDHRQVELAHLERVEEDIARQYGRLPGAYIDSVDLFQAVKDRAFKTKTSGLCQTCENLIDS